MKRLDSAGELTQVGAVHDAQGAVDALLDAAVDAIVLIDQCGRIERVNRVCVRMFGYEESELVGQNVRILMPEPDRSAHDRYMRRYLSTGEARIIGIGREIVARRKDGSDFPADLAVGRIAGAEPPRFVGFLRDVTPRKHSEEELRRSESLLRVAQELANLGNYVVHYTGHDENYWSPQLYRVLGLNPGQGNLAFEEYLERLVHAADRERVREAFADLDAERRPFDLEYRIVRDDGTVRYLHHITQAVRDEHGRVLRHVGTMHDITERRRVEDEMRQMQERLTHFNRLSTMGEMAAGIAHEINQPLTAITTYARASERLLAADPHDLDDVRTALAQIAAQALRAGEVIRRLRSFVRNREVKRESIEVNRLLEDLLLLAETDARHHVVRIRIDPDPSSPVVQADPVQVQQVILNLVRNGIDAMLEVPESQREIVLRARVVDGGQVEFTVQDRGPGIAAGSEHLLFTPFHTTKSSGTGLGLAISHSIIRAHGGKLWHAAAEGRGARFCFTLPVAPAIADS
jgi:two-component system, LuxR family, sensor kinase FixL